MSANARITFIWAALSALTLLSWWLGTKHGNQPFRPDVTITTVVTIAAVVKVRFIIREFMEVRTAPRWIGWVCDAWLLIVLAIFARIYFGA